MQVEKEQKARREIKNESVLRLAGDIRKREEVKRERDEILFELHQGRKAEEEEFKDQLEMENSIRKRLVLRWLRTGQGLEKLIVLCSGRQISWQPSTGGRGRAGRGRRRNTTGLD